MTMKVETGDFLAGISKIKGVAGWQPNTKFKAGIQTSLKQILNKANETIFV